MRPICSSGWIAPSSLFACMTVIKTVCGRMASRTPSGSMRPFKSTGRYVTSMAWRLPAAVPPSFSRAWQVLRTASCSICVVMMCLVAPDALRTMPKMA